MAKIALYETDARSTTQSGSRLSKLALGVLVIAACGPRVGVDGSDDETSAGSDDDTGSSEAICGDGIPTPGQYCFTEVSLEPWLDDFNPTTFAGDGRLAMSNIGDDRLLRVLELRDDELVEIASTAIPSEAPDGSSLSHSELIALQVDDDPEPELMHYGYVFDQRADGIELLGFVADVGSRRTPFDLNGDGIDELIETSGNDNERAWWVRLGESLEPTEPILFPCKQAMVAVADLDADGRDDLVGYSGSGYCGSIYASSAAQYVYVALNRWHEQGSDEPMLLERIAAWPSDEDADALVHRFHIGDVTGDGHVDIVSESEWGHVFLWRGNGDGTFAQTEPLGVEIYRMAVGDFDGDGTAEILGWPGRDSELGLSVWRASDSFMTPVELVPTHSGPRTLPDLNGDAVDDILLSPMLLSNP